MRQPNSTSGPPIPGYDYGSSQSAISPVSTNDLARLEQTVGWTEEDAATLERHAGLFQARAEQMVDEWRAVIGSQPHLGRSFVKPDGDSDDRYKSSVKRRFVQWVADIATRKHDEDWLNYQHEIALRHTPAKKNTTDGADTPSVVPFRYLLNFIPMMLPIRRFFADSVQDEAELLRIENAWMKSLHLSVTL